MLLLPWFDEASNDIDAIFIIKLQIKSLPNYRWNVFETFFSSETCNVSMKFDWRG